MGKMYTKVAKEYKESTPVSYKNFVVVTIGGVIVNHVYNPDQFLSFAVSLGLSGLLLTEFAAIREYKVFSSNVNAIVANFDKKYFKYASAFSDYLNDCNLTNANAYRLLYKLISEMQRSGYSDERIAEYLIETMYENKYGKELPKELKLSDKKF